MVTNVISQVTQYMIISRYTYGMLIFHVSILQEYEEGGFAEIASQTIPFYKETMYVYKILVYRAKK